jgi:hypothetical protein
MMTMVISGSDGVTFPDSTNQFSGGAFSFKNRLINGGMVIDQRNAGASFTPSNGQYLVDRWVYSATQASKVTAQQNAGAVTPPVGFVNYQGITSSSAYSVVSSDFLLFQQRIEGVNIADFAWGTANAKTVTLSFWVRSSLTGTFGGSIYSNSFDRSYPFPYSIASANTWTQISVTIPGDTTGTWGTSTSSYLAVAFNLGSGALNLGTANTWSSSIYFGPTGAVSVVGTNGATFYITGVQLEVGSVATPFERRPYGTELALCQRYAYQMNANDSNGANRFGFGMALSTTEVFAQIPHPVPMRIKPSLTTATANISVSDTSSGTLLTSIVIQSGTSDVNKTCVNCIVASGLTAFRPYYFEAANASAKVLLSAEL